MGGALLRPFSLHPHSFLSLYRGRKEPPRRQKKPAALRFRRGGESSIFAGSFFLSKLRPLCWVAVWGYEGTSGFGASLSFSSPGAAILFFLKEEKEKNGSEENAGDQWSPLRCLFWCGEKSRGAGQREHRPLQAPLRRCAPAPPEGGAKPLRRRLLPPVMLRMTAPLR